MTANLLEKARNHAGRTMKLAVRWGVGHGIPRRATRSAAVQGDL